MARKLSKEEIKDIVQWDVRTWSKALHFWESHIPLNPGGLALELGGREGGLSLWLALNDYQVICSDIGDIETVAHPLHDKYRLGEKIRYQEIDATSIPYENQFDVIAFKSIIGGIGRNGNKEIQQQVFDQIHKALKPGGVLLFAENLIASPMHQYLRKKFVRWGGEWRYITLSELEEFLSAFSKREIHSTGFASAFGRKESHRHLLSYSDSTLFNYIIPSNNHYVAYGLAVK